MYLQGLLLLSKRALFHYNTVLSTSCRLEFLSVEIGGKGLIVAEFYPDKSSEVP